MSEQPVLSLMAAIVDYALAKGLRAPMVAKVDEHWAFAVAGKEPFHATGPGLMDADLPPYH